MIDETSSKLGARNNREEILGEDKARGAKFIHVFLLRLQKKGEGEEGGAFVEFYLPPPILWTTVGQIASGIDLLTLYASPPLLRGTSFR